MPLTPQEKNAIATTALPLAASLIPTASAPSTAVLASTVPTSTILASGALTSLAVLLPLIPIVAGLTASITRPRFPQLKPGDIGKVINEARLLRKRGLEPVVSTDPFTGNVALSTQDQAALLPQLLFEAATRNQPQPSTDLASSLRQELVDVLASTAVERGFFPTVASVENLRGGVFRATPTSPIQFIQTGVA